MRSPSPTRRPPGGDSLPPSDQPSSDHFVRSYATIQNVEVLSQSRRPILHVTGYELTCGEQRQIEQRRQENWLFVDIYRLQDPACSARRVQLDEYIDLQWDLLSGVSVVQVNNYITSLNPPQPTPTRVYATIEHVEVLAASVYPSRLTLHVTGYYSDNCGEPLQIDQWQSGNWVTVEIYQTVNPAMMCPARVVRLDEYIPLRGWFDEWPTTIQVNDYTIAYPNYPPPDPPIPYD